MDYLSDELGSTVTHIRSPLANKAGIVYKVHFGAHIS